MASRRLRRSAHRSVTELEAHVLALPQRAQAAGPVRPDVEMAGLSQAGRELGPDPGVAQLGEQAARQQQVHHDTGGQVADPALETAGLLQHRVDHLERHPAGSAHRGDRARTARRPPSRHG
jgi:hypothetical protein